MPAIRHARPAIGIAAIVVLSTAINCSRGGVANRPDLPPQGGNQPPLADVPKGPGPNPKPGDFLSDEGPRDAGARGTGQPCAADALGRRSRPLPPRPPRRRPPTIPRSSVA